MSEPDASVQAVGQQLREKIASKFSAATFLAGVALLLLTEEVSALWQAGPVPGLLPLALCIHAASSVLFVSSVLRFDELTMPKKFWAVDPRRTERAAAWHAWALTEDDLFALKDRMTFFWMKLTIVATILTIVGLLLSLVPLKGQLSAFDTRHAVFWLSGGAASALVYAKWAKHSARTRFKHMMRLVD